MAVTGTSLRRREDAPLLTGQARFVDDLDVPGALWVVLARSPHAHARIGSIDTGAAGAAPGVVGVVTGEDLRGEWAGPLPCAWPVTEDMKSPEHWPLAVDTVRFAGEPVAAVVAQCSIAIGGTAVRLACDQVVAKARAIAAHQLEVAGDDLDFSEGAFSVKGAPATSMTLAAVAFEAFSAHNLPAGTEPTLEARISWDPPNLTFPFGTHVCVVEVDEETGRVDLVRYVALDDCGRQVNPMIVDGQIHGGVAQGLAQALFEEAAYDADGNLLTSTLADYLVPSAAELCAFDLDHTVTPSPSNPLGVKGIGEAGAIAAPVAAVNAVVDALRHLGVTDLATPLAPQRVWRAIQEARSGVDG